MKQAWLGASLTTLALLLAGSAAFGQARSASETQSDREPVAMTADQITHDRDLNTVTARGHVELDQGGRTLLADTLSYNMKQDVIIATGNVSLTEINGEVSFADYMELTGDMKRAAGRGIRILMIDDSRLAGASVTRTAGVRSEVDKAVYTACKPCAEDPSKPPLWDVKAERVIHDEQKHVIEYHDAWLEVAGIPTAYTPYMDQADPTVTRKSGMLAPSIINNKILGFGIRTPYFEVIDPYQDLTLAPLITTGEGDQLAATYRWRNTIGEMKTTASISNLGPTTDKDAPGWHIISKAQFDLDEKWRAGWQIERASDQDYLRTYGYSVTDPYLTTRPYVEGFGYRSYASLEAYSFQSLSTVQPTTQTPSTQYKQAIVLPLATYSYASAPGTIGDYWSFDTHAASVNRTEGTNSRRINTLTSWHLPTTLADGEVYTFTTSLRVDGYNSDHLTFDQPGQVDAGRVLPQASVEWRYPFTRVDDHASHVISPIVVGTLAPYGGNTSRIPNEDSLNFELDDINIFSPTPFSGYDRVLSGPHVAYGAEYDYVNRGTTSASMVLGQLYQVHPATIFESGTGLDGHFSDIVGRNDVSPSDNFKLSYRYRIGRDDGSLRRSEVDATIGPRPMRLSLGYVFFAKLNPTSPFDQREQVNATLTSQISRNWSTQLYSIQNLGPDAGNLQSGGRITYEDECLAVTGDVGQLNTTVRTVTAGRYMVVRFTFKTLGAFPVTVF